LAESAKSKEVIETGHGIDKPKRFKYLTSYVYFLLVLWSFSAICIHWII